MYFVTIYNIWYNNDNNHRWVKRRNVSDERLVTKKNSNNTVSKHPTCKARHQGPTKSSHTGTEQIFRKVLGPNVKG
jgi:hypothetical protein